MNKLNAETVKLITSTQVITSVSSIVKELIENSLDAGATSVDVLLANYGLDRVEVRDNGKGIAKTDVTYVGLRHYTSKITSDADLTSLSTLGFRGEAVASLCAVSEVSFTTKTERDASAVSYCLDKTGRVTSERPSHGGRGTVVVATKLYADVPVRKQMYSDARKKKQGLKELEHLMTCFGLAHPAVRLSLKHDKDQVFLKNKSNSILEAAGTIFGVSSLLSKLLRFESKGEDGLELKLFATPFGDGGNKKADVKTFVSINGRPVLLKRVEKKVKQIYADRGVDAKFKTAFCVLDLNMPAEDVDVNLSPNKWDVLMKGTDDLFVRIEKAFEGFAPKSPIKERPLLDAPEMQFIRPSSPASTILSEASNHSSANENIEGEYFDRVLNGGETDLRSAGSIGMAVRPIQKGKERLDADSMKERDAKWNDIPTLTLNRDNQRSNAEAMRDRDNVEWSRGTLIKNSNDENVAPVRLSVPKTDLNIPEQAATFAPLDQPDHATPTAVSATTLDAPPNHFEHVTQTPVTASTLDAPSSLSAAPKQQTLFESFSPRQPLRQDRVGFKEFERKIRGEIIKENRGISFARVSELVEKKWQQLEEEERMNYEAAELLQPRKFCSRQLPMKSNSGATKPLTNPTMRNNRSFASDRKRRDRSPDLTRERVSLPESRSKRQRVTAAQRVVEVDYQWKKYLSWAKAGSDRRSSRKKHFLTIVGKIQSEDHLGWILHHDVHDTETSTGLLALNPHQLVETDLYRQLMGNFGIPHYELPYPRQLPRELLDSRLSPSDSSTVLDLLLQLAGKCWMNRGMDEVILDDPRLIKNGFVIRMSRDRDSTDSSVKVELLSSSELVSDEDFCHVVRVIAEGQRSLSDSRPISVRDFLKRECQRMAKNAPTITHRRELLDVLKGVMTVDWKEAECLHGKALFHKLEQSS